ncbi:MAG: RHS repeat-associated core domain-containing protein [Deltaproteobacteria bacterium]|nr:RHS repeat-associated core domain-containing protein [Deltaproteobacteria bacterium]
MRTLQGRQGAMVYEGSKDAAGNVTNRLSGNKRYRYVYDEENRMIEAWEGSVKKIEMAYDITGNRLRKDVDLGAGRKIRTTYLGSVQIHESVVSGTVTERSVTTHVSSGGGKLLTSTRGTLGNNQTTPLRGPSAGDHYFLSDHLESPVAELNAAGTVVSRTTFEPYGQVFIQGSSATVGRQQNFGFTNQELDEYGLMNFKARYYDPSAGRFMTADPVVPDPKKSLSWNPYMYVHGNPIKFNDPTGHEPGGSFGASILVRDRAQENTDAMPKIKSPQTVRSYDSLGVFKQIWGKTIKPYLDLGDQSSIPLSKEVKHFTPAVFMGLLAEALNFIPEGKGAKMAANITLDVAESQIISKVDDVAKTAGTALMKEYETRAAALSEHLLSTNMSDMSIDEVQGMIDMSFNFLKLEFEGKMQSLGLSGNLGGRTVSERLVGGGKEFENLSNMVERDAGTGNGPLIKMLWEKISR